MARPRPGRASIYGRRMRWTDDHCHLPEDHADAAAVVADAGAAGVERLITVGCDVAQSQAVSGHRRRPPRPGVGDRRRAPTRGPPRDRRTRSRSSPAEVSSPSVSAGSTTTTTTRPERSNGTCSSPRSASPTPTASPLVIHTREAWDETFDILGAEGVPERDDLPLLHRRPRRGAAVPRPRGVPVVLGDRLVPVGRGPPGGGGALPGGPPARRDRQPVPRAGAAPGEGEPSGVGTGRRDGGGRGARGRRPTRSPRPRGPTPSGSIDFTFRDRPATSVALVLRRSREPRNVPAACPPRRSTARARGISPRGPRPPPGGRRSTGVAPRSRSE